MPTMTRPCASKQTFTKLVNVLLVENITTVPALVRDLAMIKVAATHEARSTY